QNHARPGRNRRRFRDSGARRRAIAPQDVVKSTGATVALDLLRAGAVRPAPPAPLLGRRDIAADRLYEGTVMLTGPLTRTQSLLRAPFAGETGRAHFQRRLAFTLLLVFVLAFGFWLVTVGVHPFLGSGSIRVYFTGPVSVAQLATTFA